MTHLYYTGLLLYKMGGSPQLTSSTPHFPVVGLPGGVLQDLHVELKRASRQQMYELFLVLNMPRYHGDAVGVDQIYTSIVDCLDYGDVREAINNILGTGQSSTNSCRTVNDAFDVSAILNEILSFNSTQVPHGSVFHQMEELVCQRELVPVNDIDYAYSGKWLPFTDEGVWPMGDNPALKSTDQNSNCYTRVRVFNIEYKKILKTIEDSYRIDGQDMYFEGIKLMKSLKVHFKKVLWTEKDGKPNNSCGPIFS